MEVTLTCPDRKAYNDDRAVAVIRETWLGMLGDGLALKISALDPLKKQAIEIEPVTGALLLDVLRMAKIEDIGKYRAELWNHPFFYKADGPNRTYRLIELI